MLELQQCSIVTLPITPVLDDTKKDAFRDKLIIERKTWEEIEIPQGGKG